MTQADPRDSTPQIRLPGKPSVELLALIDRCVPLKASVEALKLEEERLPLAARRALIVSPEVTEIEAALDEAFEAMWDAEDAVMAFKPRSAADIELKARFCLEQMYSDQSAGHGSDVFAWTVLRELVNEWRPSTV